MTDNKTDKPDRRWWTRFDSASTPTNDSQPRRTFIDMAGLSLLYESAYFLPLLTPVGVYFLPSQSYFSLVVLPSCLAATLLFILGCTVSRMLWQWRDSWPVRFLAVVTLGAMLLIALKGFLSTAGYDWEDHMPRGQDLNRSIRAFKFLSFACAVATTWTLRSVQPKMIRLLAGVGFTFGALAVFRVVTLSAQTEPIELTQPSSTPAVETRLARVVQPEPKRRVVWIIFDELDLDRTRALAPVTLKHFDWLATVGVSALNANSPASATLFSIPALLSGLPAGPGVLHFDNSGSLLISGTLAPPLDFTEPHTLFGLLAATGRSASVLGFYHPYCKLFRLTRCDSFPFPAVGGLGGALLANVPKPIANWIQHGDYWESLTDKTLELLPEYLNRADDLTFMHINVPHPPDRYADRTLGLPESDDALIEYSHGLLLADRILGQIIGSMQQQAMARNSLLIVSTDHWLRNRWYRASVPEAARPVPFFIWNVGESDPISLKYPVSTINTGALILDFLNGKINSQAEIAAWWSDRPVFPSYIAPNS